MVFVWFLLWIILSFVVAHLAEKKGRSVGGYLLLSLILSPVIGLLCLLAAGENKERLELNGLHDGSLKKCPNCAELIKNEARVCRFCNKEFWIEAAPKE